MEDVYYISSSLTFFFSKANIIKYFKNMSNCKNSITIINEISLSLSLSLSLYIYIYDINKNFTCTPKRNLILISYFNI